MGQTIDWGELFNIFGSALMDGIGTIMAGTFIALVIVLWKRIFRSKKREAKKPLQKKEGEVAEKKETSKKPSAEVLCKWCGKPLGQAQIDYMLGNPQYQQWCREGFCGFACFEKHKDT